MDKAIRGPGNGSYPSIVCGKIFCRSCGTNVASVRVGTMMQHSAAASHIGG